MTLVTPQTVAHRFLCPWDTPGKNTGVGCHFLFQGTFQTQKSNPGHLHCGQILSSSLALSGQGKLGLGGCFTHGEFASQVLCLWRARPCQGMHLVGNWGFRETLAACWLVSGAVFLPCSFLTWGVSARRHISYWVGPDLGEKMMAFRRAYVPVVSRSCPLPLQALQYQQVLSGPGSCEVTAFPRIMVCVCAVL